MTLFSFEFPNEQGQVTPYTFRNAHQLITATSLHEVASALQQIVHWTEQGYYAAGYVSYEAGAAFDAAMPVRQDVTMPYVYFGIFDAPTQDFIHSEQAFSLQQMTPSIDEQHYEQAIAKIHQQIYEGNTYQTNYTLRLHGQFTGDTKALFTQLKRAQQANYCAYLQTETHTIISASPELFFSVRDRTITTRPMKGTVPRGLTTAEDAALATWLFESEKNRAENVMIVDLLRNDVGKIAIPGSVCVDELFTIEQYPTVHQMTSTVTAQLEPHISMFDIFKALFPCGSITGAPKVNTMNIIQELETTPRDIYCGAIGFITPTQQATFNVAIRTLVVQDEVATYGVGGGITWDSTAASEFDEVIAKARVLTTATPAFDLLETMRLENGTFFVEAQHLERLQESAKYFNIPLQLQQLQQTLRTVVQAYPQGLWRLRLLVNQTGAIDYEVFALEDQVEPMRIKLATQPIQKNNRFLYHKTTHRAIYTAFQQQHQQYDDVLLWNEDDQLTEFTNGNIVIEWQGKKVTPPISCGLLGGTLRAHLLQTGEITEQIITKQQLQHASQIWFINSVRQWRNVVID